MARKFKIPLAIFVDCVHQYIESVAYIKFVVLTNMKGKKKLNLENILPTFITANRGTNCFESTIKNQLQNQ